MSCTQTSLVARLREESGYEMLSPRCGSSKMMLHFIYPYRLSASKHRWGWWDPAPNYRHQCDLRIGVNTVSRVSILPLGDTSHESCANLSIIRDSSDALRLLLLDNEASLFLQASECFRYALLRFQNPLLASNASLRALIGKSDNMQRYPLATPEVNSYVRGWLVSGTLGGRVLAKCADCKLLQGRYRLFNIVGTCRDRFL